MATILFAQHRANNGNSCNHRSLPSSNLGPGGLSLRSMELGPPLNLCHRPIAHFGPGARKGLPQQRQRSAPNPSDVNGLLGSVPFGGERERTIHNSLYQHPFHAPLPCLPFAVNLGKPRMPTNTGTPYWLPFANSAPGK